MATFSVMRCLTKGQAHNLKRFRLQQNSILCSVNDATLRGLGSQMNIDLQSLSRHQPARKWFSSHSSPISPVSKASKQVLCSKPQSSHTFSAFIDLGPANLLLSMDKSRTRNRTFSSSVSEKSKNSDDSVDSKNLKVSEDDSNSKKESKKESWWRGKNSWRLGLIFLGGTFITWGIGLVNIWGAPQLDPDGNEITDEFSEMSTAWAYIRRTWKEMNIFKKKIQDPSRELLLPDPLKYPYIQPPYTLVIELTGVLIHPDWTYSTGWRFKKRPGIDYFLQHVGPPLFEVVIYSQEAGMTADPLVNHLDPQGYIMYRLYRDATRYMEGKHVKDLSCLNREMSRIIMLDCNKDAVSLQPRNSLVLNKWLGEDEDRTLIDLAHFLKTIAASGVEDIRPVLDYYNQFDDPLGAFKDNQRKLQDEEEARKKKSKEESVQSKGWFSGFGVKR